MKILRQDQDQAITQLRHSLARGSKRPMLQCPTGFGKTVIASAITQMALDKGKRIIFCVPALSLIDQTVASFYDDEIKTIGVLQGNHELTNYTQPVQIASVQTLQRRSIPPADLVIIDEAHRWFKFYGEWMSDWNRIPFVGLSATPWTKGLGKHYDDLIICATTGKLISEGKLSGFKVYGPTEPDLSKCRTVAGDYHESDLAEVMDTPALTADVVSSWLKLGKGRPTLCFAVDRAHAQHLAERFQAAGVKTGYIDAFTESEEREVIRQKFHTGEIEVVCNVGCLTTGVDWDVRCISLARPTKSEILFTQIIGRGLRTADGKDHCLARDTMVLTDKGEVKIQHVTLDHKVWDGVNYVNHSGAVCRGVQRVIFYDDLIATTDHKVMTDEGWKNFEEAACRRLRIACTGVGGKPIRYIDDCLKKNGRKQRQAESGSGLWQLRERPHGALSQHAEAAKNKRLPALQSEIASYCSKMAVSALSRAAKPLHKSAVRFIRAIRRARNTVSFCFPERSGSMDSGEFGYSEQGYGDRQDRQPRPLRTRKSEMGSPCAEYAEQEEFYRGARCVHFVQDKLPGSEVCGQNPAQADKSRHVNTGNNRSMECPVVQAEREVWDILNAGPLQRFTANGRLVHNCIIIDHTSTHQNLGFVTDIHHDTLDDGKPKESKNKNDKPEKLPKACASCSFLKPAGVHACPNCGFAPSKQTQIREAEGILEELKPKGKVKKADKQEFYSGLLSMAESTGKSKGWVSHTYRDYFGVWPVDLRHQYGAITTDVRMFVKHKNIAYAKRQSA